MSTTKKTTSKKSTKKKSTPRKKSTGAKRKTKANPLFIVTNNGRIVQEATGMLDALVKKLGLSPALNVFNHWMKTILENVQSYAMVMALQNILNEFIKGLQLLMDEMESLKEMSGINKLKKNKLVKKMMSVIPTMQMGV